jgi:hypothetical protein
MRKAEVIRTGRSTLAAGCAVVGLLAASTVPAAAAAQRPDPNLQRRVDAVLVGVSGGRQVSPTQIRYDGFDVTFGASRAELSCDYGHLCMTVNGTNFDFYQCRTWNVNNWVGDGPFINNQTPGTVAQFFNQDGSVRWTSTAYQAGTATWDPIWALRPC